MYALDVDLGDDSDDQDPVVHQGDVITDLQVLVAVEGKLVDDRAPVDDRVELDRNLGLQHQ